MMCTRETRSRSLPIMMVLSMLIAFWGAACGSGGDANSGSDVGPWGGDTGEGMDIGGATDSGVKTDAGGETDTGGVTDTGELPDSGGDLDGGPVVPPPKEVQVTPPNPVIAATTPVALTSMGIYDDDTHKDITGSVQYSSSDPTVATVDAAGVVTGVGPGSAEITATSETPSPAPTGFNLFAIAPAPVKKTAKSKVTVTGATLVSISVTPLNKAITPGTTMEYKAMGLFSNNRVQDLTEWVTWTSSAPAIAAFTTTAGLVKGVSLGTATLTATHVASGKSGSTTVTVKAPTLARIQVTPGNRKTPMEGTLQYTAMGIYSDSTTQLLTNLVTWSSSNAAVATVSNAAGTVGLVTMVGPGTATITATDTASGKSGKTTLTVLSAAIVAIDISPANPAVPLGLTQELLAVETYSNGMVHTTENWEMTWTSSNPAVAVVSNAPGSEGLVTTLAVGTTTITAIDPEFKLSKSITFNVTNAVITAIQVTPASLQVPKKHTQQFQALGIFTDKTTRDVTTLMTWGTSDTATAVISNAPGSEGQMTSFGPGHITVTATDPGTGVVGSNPVDILDLNVSLVALAPPTPSIPAGMTLQLLAWETYGPLETLPMRTEEEGQEMTWSSSDPTIADVSNAPGTRGLVTAIKTGTVTITATDPESGMSGSTVVTVTAALLNSIAITPANPSVAKGIPVAFTATGTFSDKSILDLTDAVTWASSVPATVAISNVAGSGGVAATLAVGAVTITATEPLSGISATTNLTVTAAVLQSIAVDGPGYSLVTGTDTQYTATGNYTDSTTVDLTALALWTSGNPAVFTVVGGLVTPVGAGTATVTATDAATGIAGSMQVPVSTPLDPNTIAKFVDVMGFPPIGTPLSTTGGIDYYEHHVQQFNHKWHRDLPASPLWGYNGTCLGPTLVAMQGTPVRIKWFNDLPNKHLIPVDRSIMGIEPGTPEVGIVTHLHGGEVQGVSDGWPKAWIGPGGTTHGPEFVTDTVDYPNLQDAATLWYHDHREGGTRLNVVAGPAAFYLLKDAVDLGLNLPGGAYENGIAIQDRMFKADGSLNYPGGAANGVLPSIVPEFFGDVITVNGTIWPRWEVEPRKYRMHLLNGSNARVYHLWIDNAGVRVPFYQVGTEQGLMAAPVTLTDLVIMPGERVDVVFDFTALNGATLTVMNDAPVPYPAGAPVDANTAQIMQIVVNKPLAGPDTSVIPPVLRPFTAPDPATAAVVRDIKLIEALDAQGRLMLTIDGKGYNDPATETPKGGTVEVWRYINTTPDAHPMHIHLVKFFGIDRQAFDVAQYWATGQVVLLGAPRPLDPNEQGFKDTLRNNVGEVTRVVMQFPAGYGGKYVHHCHILEHEEHDMMRPMIVTP